MAYIYDLSDTWAASGTVFTGIKLNVTDTASAAGSLLMDLQVGGSSLFSVRKNGTSVHASISIGGAAFGGDGNWWSGNNLNVASVSVLSFGPADTVLRRDAANTLAQRNGVNAQAFNLYNTYTDASNYERGFMRFVSNTLRIGTEKLGTGAARGLEFQTDGVTRLTISDTGGVTAAGNLTVSGSLGLLLGNQSAPIYWSGRSQIYSLANGNIRLTNASTNDFDRLQFGGTTSAFPAIKRSSASLIVRLADDTANAALESASLKTDAPTGGTAATWKLGTVATVTATLPNRTIEVDIGGTIYYLHAKTTND